jgi:hypothetical protein
MSISLETYRHLIPALLFENLIALKITTVHELALSPPLALFRRLPAGCISLKELTQTIAHFCEFLAAEGVSGDEQYLFEAENKQNEIKVDSGIESLDSLLGGDFGGSAKGKVIEVAGDAGSGKTVCIRLQPRHKSLMSQFKGAWPAYCFSIFGCAYKCVGFMDGYYRRTRNRKTCCTDRNTQWSCTCCLAYRLIFVSHFNSGSANNTRQVSC